MPTFIHSNIIGDVYIFKHLRNIAHRVKIVSDFAQDLFCSALDFKSIAISKAVLVLVLAVLAALAALYQCVCEGRAGKLCLIT